MMRKKIAAIGDWNYANDIEVVENLVRGSGDLRHGSLCGFGESRYCC